MNPLDFFKYGNAYSRYQKGMIDPGDPSAGEPHRTPRFSRNEKWYLGPRDYSSEEQRNMAIDRDTLQLAKTIGPDLTLDEFKKLRDQVEEVHNRYKDQESSNMTNRRKQEAIWSLPEKLKRSNPTHFSPLRFKDGTPVDLDHKDPAGTEAKLKSVPFSQVEHDPRLRDAWQAAQDGHLAALMEAGEGIGADLSAALGGVSPGPQESLTEPLKKLLQPNEPEQPWSGQPVGWYKGPSAPTLQSSVKQEIPAPMVQAEMLEEGAAITQLGGGVLDKIQTGMDFAGVADPTPIIDGVNAAISLGRAVTDPKNAGRHLLNAGISAVSMFPYVGDLAKLGKYGGKAAGAAAGAGTAAGGAVRVGNQAGGQAGGIGAFIANMFGGGQGGGGGGFGGLGGLFGGGGGGGQGGGAGGGGAMSSMVDFAAIIGAAGAVATAAVGGLKMFVNWLKEVDSASRKMIEDNRDLAKYNGNLAASYARLDRDRILRDVEASKDMAGPIGRLTRAQSRYEQTQEDLTRPFKKLQTEIQALRTEVANATLVVAAEVSGVNNAIKVFNMWAEDSTEANNAAQALARRSEQRAKERKL